MVRFFTDPSLLYLASPSWQAAELSPHAVLDPRAAYRCPYPFFAELRASFRGYQPDFTSGNLTRAIALLAIPMVLEMLMQSVFGIVDIYFVGRLGPAAVAGVGLTDELLTLVFALCMGLGVATTALVARRIGERDPEAAGTAAAQALLVGAAFSLPIAVMGVFFAPQLIGLLGATPEVVEAGAPYCAILFGTNLVIMYLFLVNAIFRGAGDAFLAMKALWLANLLNMVLDPLLIFGIGPFPEMGVAGAATATSLGRGLAVLYQFYALRGSRVPIRLEHLRLMTDVMRRLLRVAWPAIIQFAIGMASWVVIFALLAGFGSDVLAGYTIAIRILIFALLPSWGMGNAAATLVGQNLGARQPARAERSVWVTSFTNMVFLGVAAVGMILFDRELITLFNADPVVVREGATALRIISYTYVLFAFGMVVSQAFNGAGDTRTPTWINVFCLWLVQLPLAWVLAFSFELGPTGVYAAVAASQALLAVVSVVWFRRGRWKEQVV